MQPSQPLHGRMRVGIVGGSGYAGLELIRLIAQHPKIELHWIFSRTYADRSVASVYPALSHLVPDRFVGGESPVDLACQVEAVFLATPSGAAAGWAPGMLERGARVVDLSADFRLTDPLVYRRHYGAVHPHPELLEAAAYGIPELFGPSIRRSRLVANPGCYPTAALLALAPLACSGILDAEVPVVVSATSGISGAGSQPGPLYHYPAATENVRPYSVPGHRHTPEIRQALARLCRAGGVRAGVEGGSAGAAGTGGGDGGEDAWPGVVFIPHLVPASRGILATCVATPKEALAPESLQERYREFYAAAPFVRVLEPPALPETKAVLGSNFCDLAVRWDADAGRVVVMAAIDNLVKGASGQAIQNLNVMMGWDEGEGLSLLFPLYP